MTDSHLRDLEHRFRASGSVADESAWLGARVQAGGLEQRGLELAAYLGHAAATLALGGQPATPGREEPLADWVRGLSAWGLEPFRDSALLSKPAWGNLVLPRAAIAVARAPGPLEGAREEAVRVAEDYVLDPDRATSRVARQQAQESLSASTEPDAALAAIAALHCAEPQWILTIMACRIASGSSVGEGKRGLDKPGWVAGRAALGAANLVGEGPARSAIRAELVPWALGYGDPVEVRVANRGEREVRQADLEA